MSGEIFLSSTNGTGESFPYFHALTNATPPSGGLWYRTPESIIPLLSRELQQEFTDQIRRALTHDDTAPRKRMILGVFEGLLALLQTGFTREDIHRIIQNLDRFTSDMIVPIEKLGSGNDYLLNESTGPTDAFKDLALQMVTEMVSLIVEDENTRAIDRAKNGERGQTLKFLVTLTSTSGDTGPAGGAGIEGKKFIINVIGFPAHEATFSQIGQMVRLTDNVYAIPMSTSFSAIQDAMKAGNTREFQDAIRSVIEDEFREEIEKYGIIIQVDSGSFNSINPGRIDGQMLYHTYGILQARARNLVTADTDLLEVIPSGNGGHVFSVLMSRLMTGQHGKTIITCNENDFFYTMIEQGIISKPPSGSAVNSASISMIIEYPNNMWRLLASVLGPERSGEIEKGFHAGEVVVLTPPEQEKLRAKITVKRVTQGQELQTIGEIFASTGRLICPHTANAVAGLSQYRAETEDYTTTALISETASPWKFLASIATGLSYTETDDMDGLYEQYRILEKTQTGCQELLGIIRERYTQYGKVFSLDIIPQDLREIYEKGFTMGEIHDPSEFHSETLRFLRGYTPHFREQIEALGLRSM